MLTFIYFFWSRLNAKLKTLLKIEIVCTQSSIPKQETSRFLLLPVTKDLTGVLPVQGSFLTAVGDASSCLQGSPRFCPGCHPPTI